MHWVDRGGFVLPKRVGGHPALDFCNTWAGWGEPPASGREWLKTYDIFAAWAEYAELVTASDTSRLSTMARREPDAARSVVSEARTLRTLIHTAALDPDDARALAGITGFVRREAEHAGLRASPEGPRWTLSPTAGLSLPVLAVARAAADLLTSPRLSQVSVCPGRDCGWLFLDPRGRRRRCSMQTCGNRAKVAAHARRRSSTG